MSFLFQHLKLHSKLTLAGPRWSKQSAMIGQLHRCLLFGSISMAKRQYSCQKATVTRTSRPKKPSLKLADWLKQAAPNIGVPISLRKFATGQSNPTYRLQTSHGGKVGRFVLRTQPSGVLLKSAHAVDREYRIMKVLGSSAVPVPDMIAMCDDPKIIGMKFFIMREVDGKTVLSPTLDGYNMADRRTPFFGQIGVLAALAKLDPVSLALQDFGKPSGYVERQLRTWTRQYRACETETIPAMEFLLKQHLPASQPSSLDFALSMAIFD